MASLCMSFPRVLLLLLFFVEFTSSHPQCLDYKPPFEVKTKLKFCSHYSSFGCCTSKKDTEINVKFTQLKLSFNLHNRPQCEKMLKEIICLECDPYAAHVFEAEGNINFDIKKATPGLCPSYCSQFYSNCTDIVNYYMKNSLWQYRELPTTPPPTTSTRSSSDAGKTPAEEFCRKITLSDMDYCFPDLKTFESTVLARKYNKGQNQGCLCVERVADDVLANPVVATHSGDGTHRLFIAEQMGVVHVLMPNTKRFKRIKFLDISDKVLTTNRQGDERGFLSLAFHPDYRKNGRFFVYYSTRVNHTTDKVNDHKTVLSEFTVSRSNPNRADHDSEKIILEFPQPEANHNGGQILFGPDDGMLYLTLGDGGAAGDPFGKFGNGLDLNTLLGSIIRIDINVKGKRAYKVPPDNPFLYHDSARPEIYAYGVRNMWRCSMDRGDKDGRGKGRFFCGDVGQNKYEEIDLIEKGGNYGWRAYEAFYCFDKKQCYSPRLDSAVFPIFAYNHTVGKSVVGGYVYRGCQNPNLYGSYIFGDTWSSRFFTLNHNKTTREWDHRELCFGDKSYCTDTLRGDFEQYVLSFGEDEAGELYLLAVPSPKAFTPKGSIYRLVDPERRGDPEECKFVPRELNTTEPLPTTPPSRNNISHGSVSPNKASLQNKINFLLILAMLLMSARLTNSIIQDNY